MLSTIVVGGWASRMTEVMTAGRRGSEIEISVSDTGDGIPPAEQARVFEPFVQVGRKAGGSGLGLAISREIIARMTGRLELVPSDSRGACFRVTLQAVVRA